MKILIFSFSHIGDAVLSTVVIPPLQKHFPGAKISVLVGPKSWEILWGDIRVDELIIYDNRDRHAGLRGKLKLIKELKSRKFDLVIDLRDSFWSRFAGGSRWGISLLQRFTSEYKGLHAVDRYMRILSENGINMPSAPGVYLLEQERQQAADFLLRNGVTANNLVIGIHPGGGWQYKLWPAGRFAALGDMLSHRYRAKVLILGGPDEAVLQNQVSELMKTSPVIVREVGLRELAALIQRCHLYIGNDTGPMHIAAAVGTQVLSIFGSTDARRSGPYGNGHIVISKKIECNPCHPGSNPGKCKRGSCLAIESVSLAQVTGIAERILNEKHTSC